MTPDNQQNSSQDAVELISDFFNDPKTLDMYIQNCIINQLKQTVENNASVLADKESFSPEEIKLMKNATLENIKYVVPKRGKDTDQFKIKLGKQSISFSNRGGNLEPRGDRLRSLLDKENRKLTLYDALHNIVLDPKLMTSYFAQPLVEGSPQKDDILNTLYNLSSAGMGYMTGSLAKNRSGDKLLEFFKNTISTNKDELIALAAGQAAKEPQPISPQAKFVAKNMLTSSFVAFCISQPLFELTVENGADLIADKGAKSAFSEDELEFMRTQKLGDISYEETTEQSPIGAPTFKVASKNSDQYLLFSNRKGSNGELRSDRLKNELNRLAEANPEQTLYEALTELRKDPIYRVQMYYGSLAKGAYDPTEKKELKDKLFDPLLQLSKACANLLKEGVENGKNKEELITLLETTIDQNKEQIFSDILDGTTPPNEKEFADFIKAKEAAINFTEIKKIIQNKDVVNIAEIKRVVQDIEEIKITETPNNTPNTKEAKIAEIKRSALEQTIERGKISTKDSNPKKTAHNHQEWQIEPPKKRVKQSLSDAEKMQSEIEGTEIKEKGIKQAEEWLVRAKDIAAKDKETQPFVEAAEKLIDLQYETNPDTSKAKEIVNNFRNKANKLNRPHVELFNWKTIHKVFSFIPAIAEIIKNYKPAIWLKREEKARALPPKLHQKATIKILDPEGPPKEARSTTGPAI